MIFEELTGETCKFFKAWQPDITKLGQCFLFYTRAMPRRKRHYTVCNFMRPVLKKEITTLLDKLLANQQADFNLDLLTTEDDKNHYITVKKYHTPNAMSYHMHKVDPDRYQNMMPMDEEIFHMKGPMGAGLCIEDDGYHYIFAAGTGLLVFMDLVAHLILKNTKILPPEQDQLKPGFKLFLHASFYSRSAKVGWDTCEQFQKLCDQFGFDNFHFSCRFSVDRVNKDGNKPSHWDKQFLLNLLKPNVGKTRKIIVCGTPKLNQEMDQSFEKIADELELQQRDIIIM